MTFVLPELYRRLGPALLLAERRDARGRALARSSFCPWCGRRGLGDYPRDGVLSLFHSPGYVGHQLFQISGLKRRCLCVHFHLPIRPLFQEKGSPQYSGPK
jgi:hypothetical protein